MVFGAVKEVRSRIGQTCCEKELLAGRSDACRNKDHREYMILVMIGRTSAWLDVVPRNGELASVPKNAGRYWTQSLWPGNAFLWPSTMSLSRTTGAMMS